MPGSLGFEAQPEDKMALLFRSYRGQSSHWAKADVADVAAHIMRAAAFHTRLNLLRLHGVELPAGWTRYRFDLGPGCVR
jgi:hypothetical protein